MGSRRSEALGLLSARPAPGTRRRTSEAEARSTQLDAPPSRYGGADAKFRAARYLSPQKGRRTGRPVHVVSPVSVGQAAAARQAVAACGSSLSVSRSDRSITIAIS